MDCGRSVRRDRSRVGRAESARQSHPLRLRLCRLFSLGQILEKQLRPAYRRRPHIKPWCGRTVAALLSNFQPFS